MLKKITAVSIISAFMFSTIVAATQWQWFPTKGEWGDIASIPPTFLNYTALLLPWVVLLIFSLVWRKRNKSN